MNKQQLVFVLVNTMSNTHEFYDTKSFVAPLNTAFLCPCLLKVFIFIITVSSSSSCRVILFFGVLAEENHEAVTVSPEIKTVQLCLMLAAGGLQ